MLVVYMTNICSFYCLYVYDCYMHCHEYVKQQSNLAFGGRRTFVISFFVFSLTHIITVFLTVIKEVKYGQITTFCSLEKLFQRE